MDMQMTPGELSRMTSVHTALAVLAIGGLLASCAASPVAVEPGKMTDTAQISLAPGSYRQLAGWTGDSVAQAVPAFVKSCDHILKQQSDGAPLDPTAKDANFGHI